MIYRKSITTDEIIYPESNKKVTSWKLGRGVIHQIDIVFPPGPQGYLHVTINRGLNQVWPTDPDASFASNGDVVSFREHYELIYPPYFLTIYTWNDDDTYPHDVIIRIGLLPRKFILRRLF